MFWSFRSKNQENHKKPACILWLTYKFWEAKQDVIKPFFQLKNIYKIKAMPSFHDLETIIHVSISSQLDCWNSLFTALSKIDFKSVLSAYEHDAGWPHTVFLKYFVLWGLLNKVFWLCRNPGWEPEVALLKKTVKPVLYAHCFMIGGIFLVCSLFLFFDILYNLIFISLTF